MGELVLAAGPAGFDLEGDDGAALSGACDLEVLDLIGDGGDESGRGFEEWPVGGAEFDVGIFEEPGGEAAHVPLVADVWSQSKEGVEVLAFDDLDEMAEVVVALEVELAGALLVAVPEERNVDAVQPGEFGGMDAVAPGVARESCIGERAGGDPEATAIE